MASTNKTAHYQLPQWVGTDKPSWVGDLNTALSTIDLTMFTIDGRIGGVSADAAAAKLAAEQAAASAALAQEAASNAVKLLTALGVTDAPSAAAFKALVENAVPKYAITASFFDAKI